MPERLTKNEQAFRIAAGSGLILLLLVGAGSWSVLRQIDARLRAAAAESLEGILTSRHQGYRLWQEQRSRLASVQAEDPQVLDFTRRLLKAPRTPPALLRSDTEAEARIYFEPVLEGSGVPGFLIVSPDLINLVSMRDQDIGLRSLIAEQRPEQLREAFEGTDRFVFNLHASGAEPESFVLAPIRNTDRQVIAVLALRLDMGIFNTVARLGRIGQSGETFAFDKDGNLLTQSRFPQVLWPPEAKTVLAGRESSGTDTQGFVGYRGKEVFGSWVWDNDLGFGIATEIEAAEAMASYRSIRNLSIALTLGIVLLAAALYFVVYRSRMRAIAILESAKRDLERQVDERTRRISIFAHAVRSASECMRITDMNDVTIFVNDAFVRTYGYASEEMIGQSIAIVRSPNNAGPPEDEILRATLAGGWKGELINRRKDGTDFPVLLSTSVIHDQQGEPIALVGVASDITRQKKAEHELIEARKAAESAALSKSQFLATMSHEIRTPMNGVIGMTQLLSGTPLSDEQRDYVGTIRSSGESLLAIINEILDFSKFESGKIELEARCFNIQSTIRDVVNLMMPRAVEKGLRLLQWIDDDVPGVLAGDVVRFKQICMNLIGNAIKFTSQGEVRVAVHLNKKDEVEAELHCLVSDTGIGIPKSRFDRLFKAFSQVDSSTTRRFGGTGLGLAISARLAAMMGGTMWVDSKPGQGSVFHFTLKAGIGREEDVEALPVTDRLAAVETGNIRILVAEDNITNQKFIQTVLQHMGYHPEVAEDGTDVVRMAAGTDYDLIFMDLQMPGMDGREATRYLRRHARADAIRPFIVAITADALPGTKEECLEAGMDAYFAKPVQIEDIQNITRTAAAASDEISEKPEDFRRGIEKLRAIGGDAFVADIVRSYLTDVSKELQRLRAAAIERNTTAVQRAAHAIKGCSNLILAEAIAETCRELEVAAAAGSFIAVDNIVVRLTAQCEQMSNDLQELLTVGGGL